MREIKYNIVKNTDKGVYSIETSRGGIVCTADNLQEVCLLFADILEVGKIINKETNKEIENGKNI